MRTIDIDFVELETGNGIDSIRTCPFCGGEARLIREMGYEYPLETSSYDEEEDGYPDLEEVYGTGNHSVIASDLWIECIDCGASTRRERDRYLSDDFHGGKEPMILSYEEKMNRNRYSKSDRVVQILLRRWNRRVT